MPAVDVNPLLNQARCYDKCIPPGMQRPVMISILANMWANNAPPCTPCPDCPDCTGEPFTFNPAAVNPLDLLGLFTYGDLIDRNGNIYAGELILNATVCVPGYDIESTTGLTAIRAPNLVRIDVGGTLYIFNNSAIVIDFGSLITMPGCTFNNNPSLATINLGSVTLIGGTVNFNSNPALTALDLSSVVTIGNVNVTINNVLLSIDLSSATTLGNLTVSNNASMTSLILNPAILSIGNIQASGCALTNVNQILACLVAAQGGTWAQAVDISAQTPPAPPTGQGILDAAALSLRGATVTTD